MDVTDRIRQLEVYSEYTQPIKINRIDIDIVLGVIFSQLKLTPHYDNIPKSYDYYRDESGLLWIEYSPRNGILYINDNIQNILSDLNVATNKREFFVKRMANRYLKLSRIRNVRYFI